MHRKVTDHFCRVASTWQDPPTWKKLFGLLNVFPGIKEALSFLQISVATCDEYSDLKETKELIYFPTK